MNQKVTHHLAKPSLWISNIKAFFKLPNQNIVTIFVISSTATFSLGIAMIIEWGLYGQNHPGYHWIIYYASSIILLPVLVWILCVLSAIFFYNGGQNLHTLPSSASSESKNSQRELSVDQEAEVEEVTLPERDQAMEDHQVAIVHVETVCNHLSGLTKEHACTSLIPTAPERYNVDYKSTMKRLFSWPLTHNSTFNSRIKRTISL
ncbi:hypothetical protein CFOL_v3_16797 [Cephalotus follicularis]|uniref:Uncharacterized protein n=1 Tax=Cephalotus follicularis TaxID=3775 RepID=A0A1Q3BZJ5_CEPFO|nr:hypothetical protein CFOL_v3_16797 [Cephalotus follicularis]